MRFMTWQAMVPLMLVLASAAVASAAVAVPCALRCDGSVNPTGIDTAQPRLTWAVGGEPGARGVKQVAAQVLVASSPEVLARDQGDLWDSGRLETADVAVPYAGRPLASGQTVAWKVRTWTDAAATPGWSEPGTWTMGLLRPTDWSPARWISAPGAGLGAIGFHAEPTPDANERKWVQVDLGHTRPIDLVRLFPMDHAGVPGFAFPRRFKVEASDDPTFAAATVLADHADADVPNPGTAPVDVRPNTPVSARFVRVTATRLVHRNNGYCFALAGLAVMSGEANVAEGAPVSAKDSVEQFGWAKAALTDGVTPAGRQRFASVLLRRQFPVAPGLRRAVAFVTGLGQYELSVNGRKVGDQLLAPGWTDYRKTVLYDTFDVTPYLRPGVANAMGLILGNGMYDILPTPGRYVKFTHSFGPPKAIARVRLEYDDGHVETLVTDSGWQVAPGPITYSNVFGGEDYDARQFKPGWDEPVPQPPATWQPAVEVDGPGGTLRGHSVSAPPIEAIESHAPIAVRPLRPGVAVYDLGQNGSHMPRLTVRGPAGASVRVIPSELLGPDGYVDRASCVQDAGGPAWWQYTLAGTGADESHFPKFFYQGCRYLQVECRPATAGGPLPTVVDLQGVVVHSAAEPIGTFACSNPLFNKIYALVRWAQRSNMMSLMTDCPHREKLGWLEELHLNGPSLRYNFRLDRLYAKQMNDMADAQLDNGLVPNIAPEYFLAHTARMDDPFRNSPEWGSSFIIVPWQQYLFTGDPDLLRTHYGAMVRYLDFLASTAKDDVLAVGLGDWYDLGPKPPWGSQLTPPPFTATAIYYYDTTILAQAADLLGHSDDAVAFRRRADRIRAAFNRKFFDPAARRYATGSQCACAMPLVLGLVEPGDRAAVLAALVADIRAHGNGLTAGDVGYRFVLRALADAGRNDVVFDMNNQSDRPGYGMQIARGATSLTEKWDASVGSFGSQDHFMLGQINEWLFHDLAGIQPDPAAPGFAHVLIRPAVVGDLSWVRASYDADRGRISVEWRLDSDMVHLSVTIPPNTTATVYVPTRDPSGVRQSALAEAHAAGATRLPDDAGHAAFAIGSGVYEFSGPRP
jgi:alpha-L-rhamnosidase